MFERPQGLDGNWYGSDLVVFVEKRLFLVFVRRKRSIAMRKTAQEYSRDKDKKPCSPKVAVLLLLM